MWLSLPRPCLQIRLHSEVLSGHKLGGHTTQPSADTFRAIRSPGRGLKTITQAGVLAGRGLPDPAPHLARRQRRQNGKKTILENDANAKTFSFPGSVGMLCFVFYFVYWVWWSFFAIYCYDTH